MIYVVILILIFCLVYIIYYSKSSKFWINQPVSRDLSCTGIISYKQPRIVEPKSNITITTIYKLNHLKDLLNNHYIKPYVYDNDYLTWTLTFPQTKTLILRNSKQLIGCIANKIFKLKINETIYQSGYVDYLCIHQNYRSQNLAPILISQTVKHNWRITPIFIFKIEKTKLPFDSICSTSYYTLVISNVYKDTPKLDIMNEKNAPSVKQFYDNILSEYNFYPTFSLTQFKHMYTFKNVISRVVIENDKIAGFISAVVNTNSNDEKFAEISYVMLSNRQYDYFKAFLNVLNKNNIKLCILIDIMKNDDIINWFKMTKGMNVHYQMYNFGSKQLNKRTFAFNMI